MYDRFTKVKIRKKCQANNVSLINTIGKGTLRWFGHMERMNGEESIGEYVTEWRRVDAR